MTHEELEALLVKTQQDLELANFTIRWMETSKFWRLRAAWLTLRQRLKFPFRTAAVSSLQTSARAIASASDAKYRQWCEKNSPRPADLQKLAETVEILPHKPLISVIVPVFDPTEPFLRDAIASVASQIYPYWQLCIAADALTELQVHELLAPYQAHNDRIKVTFQETNDQSSNGLVNCLNSALELATGEFVSWLDPHDLLTLDALYEVALLVNRHPDLDMIYSDEDKVDEKGQFKEPFFKPDWCPESFLSRMYTRHCGMYRRSLVQQIGCFRPEFEGSHDYDLVLRLTEKTSEIAHIPKILYHDRIQDHSTVHDLKPKSHAVEAAEKALEAALQRRGEPGKATALKGHPGCYLIRYHIRGLKPVTIIIPTRDLGRVLDRCLASIFSKTTYANYEVLVIDNGSTEPATFSMFKQWQTREPKRFRYQTLDIPFNYSKLNNYGVEQSQSDYLLFLNNDTEVLNSDWLTAMVEQAQRPQIGAVGARLLYPDGTVQHAGVVAGLGGVAGHSHKHYPGSDSGYFSQIQTINNYSAVTAACLMCRRDVFEQVGGFEEDLAIAFNDTDFCFKLIENGYRNVYLPHVVLHHYESKSRGHEDTPQKQARFQQEVLYIQRKWQGILANDPCYSPHLTRAREDYSLKFFRDKHGD